MGEVITRGVLGLARGESSRRRRAGDGPRVRRRDPAVRRRPDSVELAHPVDALALVLVPGHAAGRRVVVHGVAREDEHVDEIHVVDRLHDARLLVLVHRRPKGHAKHGVRLALLVVLARRTGAQREGPQEQRASPHGTHSASKRNDGLPAAWCERALWLNELTFQGCSPASSATGAMGVKILVSGPVRGAHGARRGSARLA